MHRPTPQFWDRFNKLPEPVQKVARKNFELLNKTRNTPHSISKKLANSGQYESALLTEHWQLRMVMITFGSGLETTVNMIVCSDKVYVVSQDYPYEIEEIT